MALIFPPLPFLPRLQKPILSSNPSIPKITKLPLLSPSISPTPHLKKTLTLLSSSPSEFSFDLTGDEDELLTDSPWEGAVVYKRDASAAHVELSTTLERLGMGRLSTELSRTRASAMGIRIPARMGTGGVEGTPVLVSVDVTRRKRRLKLDGVVRTVITLACNRCALPAAQSVFTNFTLLLKEDPIEDSDDEINMGVIFGEDRTKSKSSIGARTGEEEDDEEEIDPDDRLYFPSEEKEIDISKHIRDIVHVEITINAVCDASCKGLCLKCGTNLNKKTCSCNRKEDGDVKETGPLKNLRKQMQQK